MWDDGLLGELGGTKRRAMRQTSWEGEAGTEWQTGLGRAGQRRTRGQLDRPLVGEDVRIRRRTSSQRVRDWVVCNETDLLGGEVAGVQ
jgi:hypothetical protein